MMLRSSALTIIRSIQPLNNRPRCIPSKAAFGLFIGPHRIVKRSSPDSRERTRAAVQRSRSERPCESTIDRMMRTGQFSSNTDAYESSS